MYGAAIPGRDGIEKLHRRAIRLSHELEQNDCADFWIDTDDCSIPDVAELVRARAGGRPDLGWPCGATDVRPEAR